MRNDNIRNDLKQSLKDGMDDDDLVELVNIATGAENERRKKQGQAALEVNEVQAALEAGNERTKKSKERDDEVLKELREVKAEMKEVKAEREVMTKTLDDLKKEMERKNYSNNNNNNRRRRMGCAACIENDLRCTHCWKCGNDCHKKPNCPN